ncbi:MAG TPA: acyl-CoA dehydrogenase family protein, partial [Candidatus Elarobacter sp.]
ISGKKARVLDPSTANSFIVSARSGDEVGLYLVPAGAAGVTIATYAAEDGHDVGDVTFADAPGERITGNGLALLQTGLEHATAALCAEGLGLMTLMLEATVEYTKQRQQFGVPIGSFQALQHKMAEMYMELELARSMAYFAAMTLETETDPQKRAHWIAGAKAQVARSGRFVGQNAIQIHGGIGMSEEYKVGHYFKRMTIVERLLGDTTYQIARFNATAGVGEREAVTA